MFVEAELATGPTEWSDEEHEKLVASVKKAIVGTKVQLTEVQGGGIFDFSIENPRPEDFMVLLDLARDTVGNIGFTFMPQ